MNMIKNAPKVTSIDQHLGKEKEQSRELCLMSSMNKPLNSLSKALHKLWIFSLVALGLTAWILIILPLTAVQRRKYK